MNGDSNIKMTEKLYISRPKECRSRMDDNA